jgi:hypothetical protein
MSFQSCKALFETFCIFMKLKESIIITITVTIPTAISQLLTHLSCLWQVSISTLDRDPECPEFPAVLNLTNLTQGLRFHVECGHMCLNPPQCIALCGPWFRRFAERSAGIVSKRKSKKVKFYLKQAMEACRVVSRRGCHISVQSVHNGRWGKSYETAGRPLPSKKFPGTLFC